MKHSYLPQPTLGKSYEVDKASDEFFRNWFPRKWLLRPQLPDFHIDYRVEAEDNGEPSGLNFLAQIKGRNLQNGKDEKPSVAVKTKHLKYYLRCKEPVFLFLIDPNLKIGFRLFVQHYLIGRNLVKKLERQNTLTLQYELEWAMGTFSPFEKELKNAWEYMRELNPGSPSAAISAKKRYLENLDPQLEVAIRATECSTRLEIKPRQGVKNEVRLHFKEPPSPSALKGFQDHGEILKIKASNIEAQGSELLQELIRECGDQEISLRSVLERLGCLQVYVQQGSEIRVLQFNGQWTVALKKMRFEGELPESPLIVKAELVPAAPGAFQPAAALSFSFSWDRWKGKQLTVLPYFSETRAFVEAEEFEMIFFSAGQRMWRIPYTSPDKEMRVKALESLNWIQQCMDLAKTLKVSPSLPSINEVNSNSDDVKLMLEISSNGFHEQDNKGVETEIEADVPGGYIPPNAKRGDLSHEIGLRVMDFFGTPVLFGPLMYKFSKMRLKSSKILSGIRTRMTWMGESGSRFRVELRR